MILARRAPRTADPGQTAIVKFSSEHEFDARPERVAAVLCDPAFHSSVDLPDLGRAEVVLSESAGNSCRLRLRYEYVGQLDPIARRLLGNRKLTWLQDIDLDTETGRGTLRFAAEADPDRLHGDAKVALDALDGRRTRRRIQGELHVRVPVVGGTAERRILPGLVRRLDVEADAVERVLTNPE
jgi:Protein of unknown function (DUF2505)